MSWSEIKTLAWIEYRHKPAAVHDKQEDPTEKQIRKSFI